ncbi:DUF1146 family protein [Paenibacillus chitinolyticus]|uniref:DUF1146 family protein n=1 Tax=Paenibacillus TaxID=44249 RepID=UPI00020D6FB3|nr:MULTISPECIES: DUF1146 family protein [Paenibacillus]EGL13607.1 putative membrane protein [Paenibacillus sp. HGF7]EPD86212.1 hypothetical protein HMPREF1207_02788 [Paenibacillus sp. HGH0039]MBV6716817.1 DUF1146 family protein [Paenibacillus chitinolyticus]SEG62209.1 conserved hypothetical integral membrane protein [Paenibacillus sp. UNC499MF]GKS14204.1 putative membrane protein YwzB [Paenibacillus chitinolyticus]
MSNMEELTTVVPQMPLINIVVYLAAVGLSWWALQQFRFDVLLKQPRSPAAKMLQVFMSIGLGYLVASFFLKYLEWSVGLNGIF